MNMLKQFAKILLVFGLLSTPVMADSIMQPMTDSVNSGIINTKVYASQALSNTNINATVVNGVAIFSGTVNSKAQLDELVRIGNSISGIKSVDVSKVTIK